MRSDKVRRDIAVIVPHASAHAAVGKRHLLIEVGDSQTDGLVQAVCGISEMRQAPIPLARPRATMHPTSRREGGCGWDAELDCCEVMAKC